MIRIATLLVGFALVVAGCSVEELETFGDLLEPTDFRKSTEPVKQAAGNAADVIEKDRAAQEKVEEAFNEKDPEKLREAAAERPGDPRYLVYESVLHGANGDLNQKLRSLRATTDLLGLTWEDVRNRSPVAQTLVEHQLGAYWRAYNVEVGRRPIDEDRLRLLQDYLCDTVDSYKLWWGSTARGSLFLTVAGDPPCGK